MCEEINYFENWAWYLVINFVAFLFSYWWKKHPMTLFYICNKKKLKNNVKLSIVSHLVFSTTFSIGNFQQNFYPKKKTNHTNLTKQSYVV